MNTYHLSIITAEGKAFEGDVESVIAPGTNGLFGVLANHAPLVALLKKGIVQLRGESFEKQYLIASGILEVEGKNRVLILADDVAAVYTAY